MNKKYNQVSLSVMTLGCALGMVTGAAAQDASTPVRAESSKSLQLEEVIVTATRRDASVQDIPSSITALTQKQLQDSGTLLAQDIARMVPGLAYTEVNAGQAILSIRGVQTSAVFGNLQQAVALYYDDVPVLDLTIPWTVPRLQLFDVERVEVLRGPQGTLFGAGALSGAIRLINNKPNLSEYEGALDANLTTTKDGGEGGSMNLMLNAPLVNDELAVRAVGLFDRSPGWIDNPVLSDNETNRGKAYGGRIAVTWVPTEDLELIATAAQSVNKPHDSAYVDYGSDSDVSDFRVRTYNNDDTVIYNLSAAYSMPWATLTSSTSYITRDAKSSIDFSAFANRITGLTTISPLIDKFDTSNFLQEFRLTSSGDSRLGWIVGAFYEDYDFDLRETITQAGVSDIPLDFVSGPTYPTDYLENIRIKTTVEDFAFFGEVSYELVPDLTLTVGGRYSDYSIKVNKKSEITTIFDGPPSSDDSSSKNSEVTPKVSLSYNLNEDVMVYTNAAKGFRTGNANLADPEDPFTGLPIPQSYDPDTLWNYEVGAKMVLFDRRLIIDVAAFYIDWKDIQLQIRTSSGLPYTDNAGSATSKGAEITVTGAPVEGLELGTSLAYADAKMDSVAPGVPIVQEGDQLPGSAPFTAYVYGQYGFSATDTIDAALRLDYSYSNRAYTDLGNKNNPDALSYGTNSELNTRISFSSGPYEVGLFVQNVTDDRERISARDYFGTPVEIRQKPRTFGVDFRTSW